MEGFKEYESKLPGDAPKDAKTVKVMARKLEDRCQVTCPVSRIVWTGQPGDYHVKLPSTKRKNVLKKSAKSDETIEIEVHGKEYIVNATVFLRSYQPVGSGGKSAPAPEASKGKSAKAK